MRMPLSGSLMKLHPGRTVAVPPNVIQHKPDLFRQARDCFGRDQVGVEKKETNASFPSIRIS